jgi:hypothetical protein
MIAVSKTMPIKVKVTKQNKESFVGTVIESLTNTYKIGYYGTIWDYEHFELHEETSETYLKDSIVESVINQFKQRSEVGIKKYNTTLDRTDLSTLDWIEHAKQEAMDFILYLEKLKSQFNNLKNSL